MRGEVYRWFESIMGSNEKRVLEIIYRFKLREIVVFFRGFFSVDGYVDNDNVVRFILKDRGFFRDV